MSVKDLFRPVDMTQGSPVQKIVQFTIPMLIGNFAQQLYSTVDSIIVGRFVGDNALAAVGTSGPILNLMLGARRKEDLSRSIGSCITLTAITSLIIMIIGTITARPLLRLLNTPDSILDWATSYLQILFLGFAGCGYYNILGGVLRGLGDSFSALVYLIVATILNIVLDYSFVVYFNMGVMGVALATIIAQLISALLTARRLLQMKDIFELKAEYLKPERHYSSKLIRLGLPSGVTQGIFSLSMIVVQSLTNSFGEMFIAANVIVMRVDGFVMLPAFSFGTAMTTYAGQNIGAGRMDRVMKGAKSGTVTAMGTSAVIAVLIALFGKHLMGIFTTTEVLIETSYHVILILLAGYIAMEVTQCLSGIMRGAGDTVSPMWISIFTSVIFRVPAAYLLIWLSKTPEQPQGNFYMLSVSLLCSWLLGALINLIVFIKGNWKNKALM